MTLTLACAVRSVIEMLQKHNTQLESLMGDDEWVPETLGAARSEVGLQIAEANRDTIALKRVAAVLDHEPVATMIAPPAPPRTVTWRKPKRARLDTTEWF